jgi:hypothetical protein
MSASARLTGMATIALAVGFNIPFAILGRTFHYPDILREPVAIVLDRFHSGGAGLVLTWYAFMLSAVLMVPVAAALATQLPALADRPTARTLTLLSGSAAGLLQAIGLSRWVFAVPALARIQTDPIATDAVRAQAQTTFEMLNNWGGVAIGEHLGQILTVTFVLAVAAAQLVRKSRLDMVAAATGLLAALMIAIGLGEGIALATSTDPGMLGLFTVIGYMAFTVWLILTGSSLLRGTATIDERKPVIA